MAFSAAAVAAAVEETVEAVEDRCEALTRREQFIRASGVDEWPDGTMAARYRFLHVLYQQVLYERLPAARRASLHLRIGEREEAGYRARPGERAAVLAVHFERSRAAPRAVRHRRQAAEHGLQHYAPPEAVEHLTRALDLLDALPDAAERESLELEIQMTLGPALIALRGQGAAEVEAVYLRARELAERVGDGTHLYRALWGLLCVTYGRGRYTAAREMGERLLALAEGGTDTVPLLEAHHALWCTLAAMGETTATFAHLDRGFALYDPACQASHPLLYSGHDAGVCCWNHFALTQWLVGYPDRAVTALRRALSLAETLGHPLSTIMAHNTAAQIYYFRGELAAARESADRAVALNTMQSWLDGSAVLACVEMREGRPSPRIPELCQQLSAASTQGLTWRILVCFCLLAQAACERGDVEAGLDALARIPREQHGTFFASEIHRIQGELLLLRKERDEAESCFQRAIEIAHARGERSLELRAATSLARLFAREDRRDDARRALSARSTAGSRRGSTRSTYARPDLCSIRFCDRLAKPRMHGTHNFPADLHGPHSRPAGLGDVTSLRGRKQPPRRLPELCCDRIFFTAREPRARPYNRHMPAERPMPEDLADRIDALCQTWSGDPDLAAIYLFGSRAGGRGGPRSDVDLAVVLREELDVDARWRKRLALLSDACQHLGTDAVDLVILEDAPVPLGHRVLKWGRLLHDALPERRAEVAEHILRRYLDEAYLRRVLDAGLTERLREQRFAR